MVADHITPYEEKSAHVTLKNAHQPSFEASNFKIKNHSLYARRMQCEDVHVVHEMKIKCLTLSQMIILQETWYYLL